MAMRFLIFLFILFCRPAFAVQCLPADQIEALMNRLEDYTVKIDIAGSGDDGSGFLVASNLGTELVTAHHVVVDDRTHKASSCDEDDSLPLNAKALMPATATLQQPRPQTKIAVQFGTSAPHFSAEHDLLKLPLRGPGFSGLMVKHLNRPLYNGENVVIAGYSFGKNRRFVKHRCKFKRYGEALYTSKISAYELHCPGIDYDIEGMSGGIAISACTGHVIGAVSYQNFEKNCPDPGDAREVYVAPLNRNSAGQITLGPAKPPIGADATQKPRLTKSSSTLRSDGVR